MRIITGSAKGTKLKTPQGLNTRPTTDRVKESMFGILGYYVEDAEVLDIFSGTGSLSLEALSRGARSAVAIDKSAVCQKIIRENGEKTRLSDKLTIIGGDAERRLAQFGEEGRQFSLIFADPPYAKGFAQKMIALVEAGDLLMAEGVFVLEHARQEAVTPEMLTKLEICRQERYGDTVVTFLMHPQEEETPECE